MIISADTRIPFRVPRLRHLPRQAHRTRTLLAECATDRYQVAPRRIHSLQTNGVAAAADSGHSARVISGDALVDRFRHLERVRVHDCVAYRDTRIHRGGPLRPERTAFSRMAARWLKAVASSRSTRSRSRDAAAACGSVGQSRFPKQKMDRTCYRWARVRVYLEQSKKRWGAMTLNINWRRCRL